MRRGVGLIRGPFREEPERYKLVRYSPCFIPRKNAKTEKAIIEGRTIMKTVEVVITDVRATAAIATIATSGTAERGRSNSIPTL
jgi:ribosomal protein S6E (S10)